MTALIRTLIVDDERLARASVRTLLAADKDIEIVGECGSSAAALAAIRAQPPELVFLDIEMSRMNGFGLLDAVGPSRAFDVVFVTAHDSYALAAFDAHALDYVLKPFDDLRFARAVERAKTRVRQARLERLAGEMARVLPAAAPAAPLEHISVRDGERIVCVPRADIDWIGANDYYAALHVGAKEYLVREPLRDLEVRLDPARFARVHRSAIVALDRVVAVHGRGVRLRDGTELPLSRSRRAALRAMLRARRG